MHNSRPAWEKALWVRPEKKHALSCFSILNWQKWSILGNRWCQCWLIWQLSAFYESGRGHFTFHIKQAERGFGQNLSTSTWIQDQVCFGEHLMNISPPPFWKFLLLLFIWFLQCCICRCYKLCRAIWYTAQMPHHKSWYCAPKLSKGNIDRRQSNSPIGKNVTGQKWSVFLGSRVIYKKIYKKGPEKNHGLKTISNIKNFNWNFSIGNATLLWKLSKKSRKSVCQVVPKACLGKSDQTIEGQ